MDEYDCTAHPHMFSIDSDELCDNDPYINIEFDYTNINVSSDQMFPYSSETKFYGLYYVSKDKEIVNSSVIKWLSEIDVPEAAFPMVVTEISQCVCEMVNGAYKNSRNLSIRVDFSVTRNLKEEEIKVEEDEVNTLVHAATRTIEDDPNEIGYQDDWEYYWAEEMDIEVQEDDELRRTIEDDPNEIGYQDDWEYYWAEEMDIEVQEDDELRRTVEDYQNDNVNGDTRSYNWEEDMEIEDNRFINDVESDEDEWEYGWEEGIETEEDIRFVPAAKSCIEELKTVTTKETEKCSICFEDFKVGVCMPCSHMFHMDCIQDWLNISNSCPLCRFQLPTI
ncbi:unnamed protein product [Lathyrus sativus]|nr:unnamed protein product [Lathyrus sativus]